MSPPPWADTKITGRSASAARGVRQLDAVDPPAAAGRARPRRGASSRPDAGSRRHGSCDGDVAHAGKRVARPAQRARVVVNHHHRSLLPAVAHGRGGDGCGVLRSNKPPHCGEGARTHDQRLRRRPRLERTCALMIDTARFARSNHYRCRETGCARLHRFPQVSSSGESVRHAPSRAAPIAGCRLARWIPPCAGHTPAGVTACCPAARRFRTGRICW